MVWTVRPAGDVWFDGAPDPGACALSEANLEKLESVVEQLSEYSVHLEKRLTSATR